MHISPTLHGTQRPPTHFVHGGHGTHAPSTHVWHSGQPEHFPYTHCWQGPHWGHFGSSHVHGEQSGTSLHSPLTHSWHAPHGGSHSGGGGGGGGGGGKQMSQQSFMRLPAKPSSAFPTRLSTEEPYDCEQLVTGMVSVSSSSPTSRTRTGFLVIVSPSV